MIGTSPQAIASKQEIASISQTGVKIAKKLHKPYTAAFHVQAENVTYNIGIGKSKFAINFIYWMFRNMFYKNVKHAFFYNFFKKIKFYAIVVC